MKNTKILLIVVLLIGLVFGLIKILIEGGNEAIEQMKVSLILQT